MPRTHVPALTGFLAGLLAATLMALVMLVLRGLTESPSILELMADGIIGALPAAYFASLLDALQQVAKPVLYGIIYLGQLILGGAIGQWYASHLRPQRVAGLALLIWAIFGFVLLPLFGMGIFASEVRTDNLGIALSSLLATATFALLLIILVHQITPEQHSHDSVNRRKFLTWLGVSAGGMIVALGSWRLGLSSAELREGPTPVVPGTDDLARHGVGSAPPESAFGISGLPREVTPTADFYTVSKNLGFLDPIIDPRGWQLRVDGLVETPLTLTYEDVTRLPSINDFYTLQCISNEVGGDLIGNAQWKGLRLADVLAQAGPRPGTVKVVFHCADDYQVSLRLDRAMHPATIAAYEMNGAPLTKEHGAPLRIVVPGLYGLMNAKWVRRIELVKTDHKGYWQAKGWSDVATYQTSSRIDVPRSQPALSAGPLTVGGIAFAGDRGLAGVEVSFDKGKTWQAAELKPPLSQYAWGLWRYTWSAVPGSYTIQVRAIDGLGQIQPAEIRGPLPDGATGLHDLSIKVVAETKPRTTSPS